MIFKLLVELKRKPFHVKLILIQNSTVLTYKKLSLQLINFQTILFLILCDPDNMFEIVM